MGAETTFTIFADTRVAGLNGRLAGQSGWMTKAGVTFAATPRAVTMSAGSMRDQPAPISRNRGFVETIIFRTIKYHVQVIGDKLIEFRL